MINLLTAVFNLGPLHLVQKRFRNALFSSLHTRSLPHHKEKPSCWNTSHPLVQKNSLLSLFEKCQSFIHMKQIQTQMSTTGLILNGFALSRLIAFCAISEWRNLSYCIMLLQSAENLNAFSWNVSIRGFAESETPLEALVLYRQMLINCGSAPDNHTYPFLFKVCANLYLNSIGKEILGHVIQSGFQSDLFVHNAVIHMLVSCRELEAARNMFDERSVRDLVSWNSMINGYARSGLAHEALTLYHEMDLRRINPDEVTMIGVVSSCAQLKNLSLGLKFHRLIEETGLNLTIPLSNALMDMYVKCGNLEAAKILFEDVTKRTVVSWTTMVVGYAKFGCLDSARRLFNHMPEKNVVSWNALISACVQGKRSKEALSLFHEMQANDVNPDELTMVSCLCACSQIGTLDFGIWIHQYIEKHNFNLDVTLGTALIDMYAKCGSITKALQVFRETSGRNSLTWTSIICGLALHGRANDALCYFSDMIYAGLKPDEITFLGVLSACSHGGLVDQGRMYFNQMSSKFNISPKLKHYSSMVDLLGRAGFLQEAEELINSMPMEPDAAVWGALFSASRAHRDVSMGERAALKLLELDPNDSGIYVLLANMYRDGNMWEEGRMVRKMMEERGVEKIPGCSWIEVSGIVNEFIVGNKSHPKLMQIYDCLVQLARQMKLFGFDKIHFQDNLLLNDEVECKVQVRSSLSKKKMESLASVIQNN